MPMGIAKPACLSCVAPVLISSFLWLEKESVEVDSELDKPGKPNWGLICWLTAHCHHCHGLGRTEECQQSGSASSKSENKSEREVHGEVEAHGQRASTWWTRRTYRILPSKAGCTFCYSVLISSYFFLGNLTWFFEELSHLREDNFFLWKHFPGIEQLV